MACLSRENSATKPTAQRLFIYSTSLVWCLLANLWHTTQRSWLFWEFRFIVPKDLKKPSNPPFLRKKPAKRPGFRPFRSPPPLETLAASLGYPGFPRQRAAELCRSESSARPASWSERPSRSKNRDSKRWAKQKTGLFRKQENHGVHLWTQKKNTKIKHIFACCYTLDDPSKCGWCKFIWCACRL